LKEDDLDLVGLDQLLVESDHLTLEEDEEPDEPISSVSPIEDRKLDDQQIYDQLPYELRGVYQLVEEKYFPPVKDAFADQCIAGVSLNGGGSVTYGANVWGIPNLRPDMLVSELPKSLKVWGDRFSTADDGESWYLFNYGAVKHIGLPFERSVYAWFTHDHFIESWWANPAYRVGQILTKKVSMAVVPDFSFWEFTDPSVPGGRYSIRATQLLSLYRAHWLGRFMQEAGIRIIPRLEFFIEDFKPFSLIGIPKSPPVVATQMHTKFEDEHVPTLRLGLEQAVSLLKPKTLLVYASERGAEVVNGADVQCDVVILPSASIVRRGRVREKETNPWLKDLRKRGRQGAEVDRVTNPYG
jgi:hypothetical protein